LECQYGDTVLQSQLVISPTLTVVEAKFRHQHPSSLHSNFHSIFCRELGAFFAGKHLAT